MKNKLKTITITINSYSYSYSFFLLLELGLLKQHTYVRTLSAETRKCLILDALIWFPSLILLVPTPIRFLLLLLLITSHVKHKHYNLSTGRDSSSFFFLYNVTVATILHNKQLTIDFRLTAKVIDKMNLVLSNESASQEVIFSEVKASLASHSLTYLLASFLSYFLNNYIERKSPYNITWLNWLTFRTSVD